MTTSTKRQIIETTVHLNDCFTECSSLGEIQALAIKLISIHGPDTKIKFDAGYNNIDEVLVVSREETDAEVNARIDKEIEKLILKQKKTTKVASEILSSIETLKSLKL